MKRVLWLALLLPLQAHGMSLLVDKSDEKLWVIEEGRVVAEFDAAVGRGDDGHKRREGDKRTPEGTYTLHRRICQTCRYKRAFWIDYPNARDKAEGRTGGAILIHAHNWGSTSGCIGVEPDDFERLWRLVPSGTRIEIRP